MLVIAPVMADQSGLLAGTERTQVFWGDTHVHTNMSVDAYLRGNTEFGPEAAYRFARGDVIVASDGTKYQLKRPLDFIVIADHASNMRVLNDIALNTSDLLATKKGGAFADRFRSILSEQHNLDEQQIQELWSALWKAPDAAVTDPVYRQGVWEWVTATADSFNAPGRFTTFIGFEWSAESTTQGIKNNRHRVVVFRDGAAFANQVLPFSKDDSLDPEDLWRYLEDYEEKTGGRILAIPHNANLSVGEMFGSTTAVGESIDRSYAERRQRWEPLYEIVQYKGSTETHPALSVNDEFADFEIWNSWLVNIEPLGLDRDWREWDAQEIQRKSGEYARSAWLNGLEHGSNLGVNPFKFGVIGSTDTHTSLSSTDERTFLGKWLAPGAGPDSDRALRSSEWIVGAGGMAGVWAVENNRDAIFSALIRKEAFATTGPRIAVRFFGGWEFPDTLSISDDLVEAGYEYGVPMGGDLFEGPKNKPLCFIAKAAKDPTGANLDRIQIIKGWRNESGESGEKIYNVALSDNRSENEEGLIPQVRSTVDVANASYTNSVGAAELAVIWCDPDFDREESAFYYARVIEIPTPRWTAYDAKRLDLKLPNQVPTVIQERAYTSPIWYTPN